MFFLLIVRLSTDDHVYNIGLFNSRQLEAFGVWICWSICFLVLHCLLINIGKQETRQQAKTGYGDGNKTSEKKTKMKKQEKMSLFAMQQTVDKEMND